MKKMMYALMMVVFWVAGGWSFGKGAAQGTTLTYLPLATKGAAISPTNITAFSNGFSYDPHSSATGSLVAFLSDATNLVTNDTNGVTDAFVWEKDTGQFRRASVASNGTEGNGFTTQVWLSGNGRYVLFTSTANNLTAGDTNDSADLYRHDLWSGVTELVSVTPDGVAGGGVESATMSEDGNQIFFTSSVAMTTDPIPTTCARNPCTALFRRDMVMAQTSAALLESDGTLTTPIREIFTNSEGTLVVYERIEAAGSGCIPDGGCGTQYGPFIWRRELDASTSTLIARSDYRDWGHAYLNAYVQLRGLAPDGNTVAYWSSSEGGSGSGGNSSAGLVVKKGTAAATSLWGVTYWTYPRASGGYGPNDYGFTSSADGNDLIFSAPDLSAEYMSPQLPDDTNGYTDLFRVRNGQYLRLANPMTSDTGDPSLSADGKWLYFISVNIDREGNYRTDIFVATMP